MAYGREVTGAQLPTFINNLRNHPVLGTRFRDMDDWEIYQAAKDEFLTVSFPTAPDNWKVEHLARLGKEEESDNLKESLATDKQSRFSEGDEEQGRFKLDWIPKWMGRNAISYGANSSITAMTSQILTGERPFFVPEDFDPEDMGYGEFAISMAGSLLPDFYLFFSPFSGTSALATRLAGKTATNKAAQHLSKYFLGRSLESKLATKAVEEGFEGLTKKNLGRAFQGKVTAGQAKDALIKDAGLSSVKVNSLYDDAVRVSDNLVKSRVPSREWFAKGLTVPKGITGYGVKTGDVLLPQPLLRQVFHRMGIQGAKALGAYSGVSAAESQIVAQLEKEYGKKGLNIYERFKKTGYQDDLLKPLDPEQIIYGTIHGFLGGYVASGLAGVRFMGKSGAFTEKSAKKWVESELPKAESRLYNGIRADAGWLTAEGLGFTLAGKVTESGAKALGMEVPHEAFGESLIKNIMTFGVIKSSHAAFRKTGAALKKPVDDMKAFLDRKSVELLSERDRLKNNFDETNANDKAVLDAIDERYRQKQETNTEYDQQLTRAYDIIREYSDPAKLDSRSHADLERARLAQEVLKKISRKILDDPSVSDKMLLRVERDLKEINKDWELDRVTVDKDIDANLQRRVSIDQRRDDLLKGKDVPDLTKGVTEKVDVSGMTREEFTAHLLGQTGKVVQGGVEKALESAGIKSTEGDITKRTSDVSYLEFLNDTRLTSEEIAPIKKQVQEGIDISERPTNKSVVDSKQNQMAQWSIMKELMDKDSAEGKVAQKSFYPLKQIMNELARQGKDITQSNIKEWQYMLQDVADGKLQYNKNTGEITGGDPYKTWKGINSLMDVINDNPRIRKMLGLTGDLQLKHIKKLSPGIEIIEEDVGEIKQEAYDKARATIRDIKSKGSVPVKGSGKFDSSVASIIHYLHMEWGKRQVAMSWGDAAKKVYVDKGTISSQVPIRMKDVVFDTAKDGTPQLTLTLYDKRPVKGTGISANKRQIVLYKEKESLLPYDPYTEIKKQYDLRMDRDKAKAKSEQPLLTYQVGKKILFVSTRNIREYAKQYYIPSDSKAHQTRHMWVAIEEAINNKLVSLGDGRTKDSLLDFIDWGMLGHKPIGTTVKKYYSDSQLPVVTSFRQRALLEMVKELREGKLTKESFTEILKKYDKQYIDRVEAARGWAKDDNPSLWFGGLTSADPFRIIKRRKQHAGLSQHRVAGDKELRNLVIDYLAKNRGLKIQFLKNKSYAGELLDGVIRLTEGKASIDTFFHENIHRLESFARSSGDSRLIKIWERGEKIVEQWAKKNDSGGWLRYKEAYGKDAANEYLTQLGAEWSVERATATGIGGRLSVWFKQLVSRIKAMVGIHNAKDVSRIFGEIAEKGFATEGTAMRVRKKSIAEITKDDMVSEEQANELKNVIRDTGVTPSVLFREVVKRLGIKGAASPGQLTQIEYSAMREFLDSIHIEPEGGIRRTQSWRDLRKRASIVNVDRGIKDSTEKALKEFLRIRGGSFKNASERQMQQYIDMVENMSTHSYGKGYARDVDVIDANEVANLAKSDSRFAKLITKQARFVFPVDYVLRKMGAHKLADNMLEHFRYEQALKGEADHRIQKALGILKKEYGGSAFDKNRRMLDKYMAYVMDPTLVKGANLKPEGERFVQRGLKDPSSPEYKAFLEIRKFTDYYWDTLLKVGKKNIKNPRLLDRWIRANNKKFVENYFSRVLTEEAREYFDRPENKEKAVGKIFNKLVDDIVADRSKQIDKLTTKFDKATSSHQRTAIKKEVRGLEKERDALLEAAANKDGTLYKKLMHDSYREMNDLIFRRRESLNNPYLLERSSRLPNFIENKKTGKQLQVWETNFSKVMGRYIEVMSKYLATGNYFPSFVRDFRSPQTSETYFQSKVDVFKTDGSPAGAYVDKALKKRLGLELRDSSGDYWKDVITKAGSYSAVFGLSSPFSGIKNLVIATTNTIGLYDTSNFLRGMALMFHPQGPQAREIVTRIGGPQIGTKEIELGGTKGDWWMRKISLMKPTEAFNRFFSSWAGLFSAQDMVARLQGNSFTLMGKKSNANKIRKYMNDMWHLTEQEINFAVTHGLSHKSEGLDYGAYENVIAAKKRDIRDKILHYSHIKTQGATAEPFMPLWAQQRYAKGATLFYRMAYAGTANVSRYVVAPALKGDILPAVQYAFAGNLLGGALWGVLESVVGTTPPKANESVWDRIMMNWSKAEVLGLFSFFFSPYDNKLSSDSIMQPAIIRNMYNGSMLFYNTILGPVLGPVFEKMGFSKFEEVNNVEELSKRLSNLAPFAQHLLKGWESNTNPYKKQVNRTKTFRNAYLRKVGLWDSEKRYNPLEASATTNQNYYNLIREAWLSNDFEAVARYYWITKLYMWDNYRDLEGKEFKSMETATRTTHSALQTVIDHINPLHFPADYNEPYNRKQEFLSYLSESEKEAALKAEKTFRWKRRTIFRDEVQKFRDKYLSIWKDGYYIDAMPIPPKGKMPPFKIGTYGKDWGLEPALKKQRKSVGY